MQQKVKLAMIALCYSSMAAAQNTEQKVASTLDENAFTFTEAQLGEDDNISQNVTILNSNSNVFASEAGYLFSPMRFRYRAFNQKHNDVYINGAPVNEMETGQFRFSNIGGLNRFSRNVDFALPFEGASYGMVGMAGSNNYDFRAGSMQVGQYASVAAANRNYTLRGMYTYSSGFNDRGWAISAGITYRWANRGYVEGTFYNSLSYYLGVQKKWNNGHSLSFSTWGNPTERSNQGAATDETYWLTNNRYYNPYWGYQNGKKRNSRIVNDFAPSAILTWDWDINEKMKLTTSAFGKHSMYKSTKLEYNNAENPQPDYYKNMPSAFYYVWNTDHSNIIQSNSVTAYESWLNVYNAWTSSKANQQLNWDRLYYSNQKAAANGSDAMYFIQAKHTDALTLNLASTLTAKVTKNSTLYGGFNIGANSNRHYQTMEDLLGGSTYHNINTHLSGSYASTDSRIQYDLNHPNALVGEGDKFGYDYKISVLKGLLWMSYTAQMNRFVGNFSAKLGQTNMRRHGYMKNGLFPDSSEGNSEIARMGEGGAKGSLSLDAGRGHTFKIGVGYEWRPPMASAVFMAPEMYNSYAFGLKDEKIFSSEFSYQYQNAWLHANLNAYYSRLNDVTEWQCYYDDAESAFTYVSMSGIKKEYCGVELGLDFKLTSFLNFKAIGAMSDAMNINNCNVAYLNSNEATIKHDIVYNKNMRESGTPLTVGSLGLDFHSGGWFINLNANYYDRIYLSYSPMSRYGEQLRKRQSAWQAARSINDQVYDTNTLQLLPEAVAQAKGHGGWMVDASIGKNVRLKHGSLNFNLMLTNVLNNRNIVSGGYEQSRTDISFDRTTGEYSNTRVYKFSKNPKKFYVWGTNGMFQVSYRF